ncbi:hypothetical protein [Secundilactobacillus folii]|uniref:Extracellular protein n=1 Tax=Secundilactobacillus folii TaxID=2678357 RepID=A0A7X3C3U9_9LACO|nr:hypothetical protein [Secundilactobacillus folii]MTV82966.1 hypothetical protein [Secundilactobacillus folii]
MKHSALLLGTVLGTVALFASSTAANAASYTQRSNALTQYSSSSLRVVNNKATGFVKAGTYQFAKNTSGANTISGVAGNQKWTLKTKYQLPTTHAAKGNSKYDMTNPQSSAYDGGHFLYVVYQPHYTKGMTNKGFVARYDLRKLDGMSLAKQQELLDSKTGSSAVKIGGIFTTGHGQSLAYDKKHHSLYMWRDKTLQATRTSTLQRISTSSLKPNKAITFHMTNHGANVPGGHELAFDHSGNAYFWTVSGSRVKVYKGTIGSKTVHFRLTKQMFSHRPGTHEQAMGYNAHNGRLYLVADDSITSFPAKKLNGRGSLKASDFKYTKFNSHREFEALNFDNSGHGMLLSNRNPEVLRSTTAY